MSEAEMTQGAGIVGLETEDVAVLEPGPIACMSAPPSRERAQAFPERRSKQPVVRPLEAGVGDMRRRLQTYCKTLQRSAHRPRASYLSAASAFLASS